jgi:hypothetical protein
MSENTPYFDAITSDRSIFHFKEDEEASLEGKQLISIESEGTAEEDFFVYVTENFSSFYRLIRYLKREDQDLLLAYYCLHKTQNQLGPVFGCTQTICSQRLRMAVRTLCAYIIFGGIPTADQLRPFLEKAGWEEVLLQGTSGGFRQKDDSDYKTQSGADGSPSEENIKCSLSEIIVDYARTRNFVTVANKHGVHRPDVRRKMKKAAVALGEMKEMEMQAIGAYILRMIDKANPAGAGDSARQKAKQGPFITKDSPELGAFRVEITAENGKLFEKVFASRASL